MSSIARWIRHNQGIVAALVIVAGVMIWTFGCQSKVTSLVEPGKMVNADELNLEIETESRRLQAELDALIARAGLKLTDLARQDAIKRQLFEFAALSATTGTVNTSGVVLLAASILGVGAGVDNRIKDKVIKNRPLAG